MVIPSEKDPNKEIDALVKDQRMKEKMIHQVLE